MHQGNRWRQEKIREFAQLVEEFSRELDDPEDRQPLTPRARFTPPTPPYRQLRCYAIDPSLATRLDSVDISQVIYQLPWEVLQPGPIGEYLEVMDIDPASDCFYEPINLDHPALLAQHGLPPNEGLPQFHQQMVYAVCSLTIRNFERALGRKALWRPKPPERHENQKDDSHYVQRLRVYPHALREANAFYSPQKIALLFGYFTASASDTDMPGGRVFTCLSHDIVAHETTHALLDGMHRRFLTSQQSRRAGVPRSFRRLRGHAATFYISRTGCPSHRQHAR